MNKMSAHVLHEIEHQVELGVRGRAEGKNK